MNDPINGIDPSGLTYVKADVNGGTLEVDPENGSDPYTISMTTGRGTSMNNSSCSNKPNEGSIPSGQYTMSSKNLSRQTPLKAAAQLVSGRGDWGSFRVPLDPYPGTDTKTRSGFFMHGGVKQGSAGCIDVGGGLTGNDDTKRLVNEILADPDGTVPVFVK